MANPRAALREALVAYGEGLGRVDLRPDLVIDTAWDLIEWMEANDIDPGEPPQCGCGGYHWSCPGPDDDERPDGFEDCSCDPEVGHTEPCLLTPLPGDQPNEKIRPIWLNGASPDDDPDSAYPYCALHGHSFEPAVGCTDCIREESR